MPLAARPTRLGWSEIHYATARGPKVRLRYATVCKEHGASVGSETRADAIAAARDTALFCAACREDEDARRVRGEPNWSGTEFVPGERVFAVAGREGTVLRVDRDQARPHVQVLWDNGPVGMHRVGMLWRVRGTK